VRGSNSSQANSSLVANVININLTYNAKATVRNNRIAIVHRSTFTVHPFSGRMSDDFDFGVIDNFHFPDGTPTCHLSNAFSFLGPLLGDFVSIHDFLPLRIFQQSLSAALPATFNGRPEIAFSHTSCELGITPSKWRTMVGITLRKLAIALSPLHLRWAVILLATIQLDF
jgi:hypothetical protein